MEFLVGTDNLHFKRKQSGLNSLERKSKKRERYKVIMIVCEGSKTEPNYFKGLRNELGLNPANIQIECCPNGNDPVSIINHAINEHKKNDYDKIYCVFDKDAHSNYQQALNKIRTHSNNKKPIYAIPSVPCFEYWLLLHFEDSSKPYQQKGNKSAGEQLKSEIKKHIKHYNEADKDVFVKTKENLQIAITRAKQIESAQKNNDTDNPSTKVYKLVEDLINISKSVLSKGLSFTVCTPNKVTIAAMEAANRNEDLEKVTLEQLRSQFQKDRHKKASKQKNK